MLTLKINGQNRSTPQSEMHLRGAFLLCQLYYGEGCVGEGDRIGCGIDYGEDLTVGSDGDNGVYC